MSVGLLLVTHQGIGNAIRTHASQILGFPADQVPVLEIETGIPVNLEQLEASVNSIDQGEGVLVMTDLPGATPSNIARKADCPRCRLISGLNLPMLIRAWSYRERPLDEVARLAIEGAQMAVMELR